MQIPTDEEYIDQARKILVKIERRIEVLSGERERLAKDISAMIAGSHCVVKVCPLCGGAINPYAQKTSPYYLQGTRTFHCTKCDTVFSIIIRHKERK